MRAAEEGSNTMIGSTPMASEANWHPVHRANAMLRAALLSSARSAETNTEILGAGSLPQAIESVFRGPVNITFPRPLAARLAALTGEQEDAFPAFEVLAEDLEVLAEDLYGDAARSDTGAGVEDAEEVAELELLERGPQLVPQVHVQSLLEEFRQRQRQASLLVAGSIVTAVVLTLGGLLLVASLAAHPQTSGDNRSLTRSSSVAWQPPAHGASLHSAANATNRAEKGEPFSVPGTSEAQVRTILAESGRQIAFAPLLPPSRAGYFMIRGLPMTATLSAGRQSDSGTWLVKAELANDLSLAVGNTAGGDYPVEVYVLQSGDQPQARRSFLLRVEAPQTNQAAVPNRGWASALLDVVPAASAAEAPAVDAASLRERSKRLMDEGDIAAARLLLLYLAERGEGEAAYDLARTYDREMLDELGAKGIAGDIESARGWYERAAQIGNTKAAERLKILASTGASG
jgi:hypothetical protein